MLVKERCSLKTGEAPTFIFHIRCECHLLSTKSVLGKIRVRLLFFLSQIPRCNTYHFFPEFLVYRTRANLAMLVVWSKTTKNKNQKIQWSIFCLLLGFVYNSECNFQQLFGLCAIQFPSYYNENIEANSEIACFKLNSLF